MLFAVIMRSMPNTSSPFPPAAHWRDALRWGFGTALIHRLFLTFWLATVWLVVGEPYGLVHALEITEARGQSNLPLMETPIERAFLGIWRRWDGTHYLNLAQNGYRLSDPGPTVFSPLAPVSIRLMDTFLPGPAEIAGIIFSTLMFGLALTFLYRLTEACFHNSELAKRSVIVFALLPLSYFFAAPMSEAPYVAMVLAFCYFGFKRHWWLAGIFGGLATLARSQGVMLLGIGGLLLIEQAIELTKSRTAEHKNTWSSALHYVVVKGFPLILLPVAYGGFLLYRNTLGLPSMDTIFRQESYVVLVDPITGLISNFRQIFLNPVTALQNVDSLALVIAIALTLLLIREKRFRRGWLIAFCAGYLLVFVSKLNYPWGEYTELLGTQSMARYTLTLFPFTILLADYLGRAPKHLRMLCFILSALGLLVFSAQFAMGGGPA